MSRTRSAEGKKRSGAVVTMLVLLGIFLLVILPFVPLLLAVVESSFFGTRHVEELCERIGIHGLLSKLYEPLIEFIMGR